MTTSGPIVDVGLAGHGFAPATPDAEQDWRLAVFDLLEKGRVTLGPEGGGNAVGRFRLVLSASPAHLAFEFAESESGAVETVEVALSRIRGAMRDYSEVCSAYYGAVRSLPAARIEVIDQARRQIHDEGGRLLSAELAEHVSMNLETGRSLFALICALPLRA